MATISKRGSSYRFTVSLGNEQIIKNDVKLRMLSDALKQLNEEGQNKLLDYASDLVATGRYQSGRLCRKAGVKSGRIYNFTS